MTTFSYTTGNPSNLTAGATASMNDIQGPFTDLRTFLNGKSIDVTNIANSVFGGYKTVAEARGLVGAGSTAALYMLPAQGGVVANGGNDTNALLIPVDPAYYTVSGLTAQMRLVVVTATNSVAPAVNFTYGLHALTGLTGTGNLLVTVNATAVTSSTVTHTTPGAGAATTSTSSDFAVPAANTYRLCVTTSGTTAANSGTMCTAYLQMRYT